MRKFFNKRILSVILSIAMLLGTAMPAFAGQYYSSYGNMDESLAAACVSTNPAKDLGLITRGELRPGKRADITILDTKTNRVRMTVSRGNIIYDSENPDI